MSKLGLQEPRLDGSVKGWPDLGCFAAEVRPGELTVERLPTPSIVVREDLLRQNIRVMADWCRASGVIHAPHAKTTMAPSILSRQLAAGAWGLTAADARQARVALLCGARNVLIANEIVEPGALAWLGRRHAEGAAGVTPSARVLLCVDSEPGLALAEDAHRRAGGPPLEVLLELGYEGGRCGVRTVADASRLARAIAASEHVRLCGVEAYEGLLAGPDGRPAITAVDELLERLAELARLVAPLVDVDEPLISAGGSSYFDRVVALLAAPAAELGWRCCLRSGCYVTHDHGLYARLAPQRRDPSAPSFQAAIAVRTSVLSRPQPDLLILDCGRRDLSYDAGLPTVIAPAQWVEALQPLALNDQHAHVAVAADCAASTGDVVTLGISHPCTTLERWRVLAMVDEQGGVRAAAPTYF